MIAAKLNQMLEVAASRWKQPIAPVADYDRKAELNKLYSYEEEKLKKFLTPLMDSLPYSMVYKNVVKIANGWGIPNYYTISDDKASIVATIVDYFKLIGISAKSYIMDWRHNITVSGYSKCEITCYNSGNGIVISFRWTKEALLEMDSLMRDKLYVH